MDARTEQVAIPLAIDLDGTLIATDLLWEGLFLLLRKNPLFLFMVPLWLARGGPARLKCEIADRVDIDPAGLPYRPEVMERLRANKTAGRRIILATGTPRKFAEAIAAHLGLFDDVLATDRTGNLTSRRKSRGAGRSLWRWRFRLCRQQPSRYCLFRRGARSVDRRAGPGRRRAGTDSHGGVFVETQKPTLKTYLKMLRAHQWLKNVLIAVPMILSHEYLNTSMLIACAIAFVSFSAAASAIYIVNDFFDLALDRQHAYQEEPAVCERSAVDAIRPGQRGGAFGDQRVCRQLSCPGSSAQCSAGYLVVTTAYSLSLKRMLLIDVMTLAGLYTMRIMAGAAATGTDLSFWLLAFSIFFFLSLALVKRYVELRTTDVKQGERIAGRGYRAEDQEVIAQAGMASAFSSALVLALYIHSDAVVEQYPTPS
jgi:4-hydroxybenzoate polyprenyltransferase